MQNSRLATTVTIEILNNGISISNQVKWHRVNKSRQLNEIKEPIYFWVLTKHNLTKNGDKMEGWPNNMNKSILQNITIIYILYFTPLMSNFENGCFQKSINKRLIVRISKVRFVLFVLQIFVLKVVLKLLFW